VSEDVVVVFHFSGSNVYKVISQKMDEMLKVHCPQVKVEQCKKEDVPEHRLDVRVRRCKEGGADVVIHSVENVPETEVDKRFEEEFPKLVEKFHGQLRAWGYEIVVGPKKDPTECKDKVEGECPKDVTEGVDKVKVE